MADMTEETAQRLLERVAALEATVAALRAERDARAEADPAEIPDSEDFGGGETDWEGRMGRVPPGVVENPAIPPIPDADEGEAEDPEAVPPKLGPRFRSLDYSHHADGGPADAKDPHVAQIYGFDTCTAPGQIDVRLSVELEDSDYHISIDAVDTGFGQAPYLGSALSLPFRVLTEDGIAKIVWGQLVAGGGGTITVPGGGQDYEEIKRWYYEAIEKEEEREEESDPDDTEIVVPGPGPDGQYNGWRRVRLSDYFWKLGGGATECYGAAIGNSQKTGVVDLDGQELVGSWIVEEDLDVRRSANVDGTLTVSGNANLGTVATGPLDVGGTFRVAGDVYGPANVTIGTQNYTILVKT